MSRYELVAAGAAAIVALYLLMLRGWRNRQRRQAFLPAPPAAPQDATTVVGSVPGLFVGTTFAGDWLDRVAVHGLCDRATADLSLSTAGVVIDRDGAPTIYLPYDAIAAAQLGDRLAGKVMGKDGLLLVTWRLGDRLLTSAFRADDHDQHERLAEAITSHTQVAA
jgi:hypothetical protein